MCHKGTATEEPGGPPFCKHSVFTEGFPAEVRFKAVKGNSCWTDSGSDLIEGLHVKFLRGATDVGGTESGSTHGARGKRINLLSKREGRGRIFQSDMSCLARPPSFPLLLCLFTLVWYLFRPQKSTATVAQVPKESLSLFMSLLPLLSLPLFLSDFQYLSPVFSSAASSKCLQITQLWNSTLHLYLCLLGQYAFCGLRFCSVADRGS